MTKSMESLLNGLPQGYRGRYVRHLEQDRDGQVQISEGGRKLGRQHEGRRRVVDHAEELGRCLVLHDRPPVVNLEGRGGADRPNQKRGLDLHQANRIK